MSDKSRTQIPASEPKNLIQKLLRQRAQYIVRQLEEADVTKHPGTVGSLREAIIRDMVRLVLPEGLDVCSGFVTDAFGCQSPQIDIVVYRKGEVSPIFLLNEVAVIPFEAFVMGIEIKSNLKKQDLDGQITKQAQSLSKMIRVSTALRGQTMEFKAGIPPLLIISYENDVGRESIKTFMRINGSAIYVVCLNSRIYFKDPTVGGSVVTEFAADSIVERLLRTMGDINKFGIDLLPYITLSSDQKRKLENDLRFSNPDLNLDDPLTLRRIFAPSLRSYIEADKLKGPNG